MQPVCCRIVRQHPVSNSALPAQHPRSAMASDTHGTISVLCSVEPRGVHIPYRAASRALVPVPRAQHALPPSLPLGPNQSHVDPARPGPDSTVAGGAGTKCTTWTQCGTGKARSCPAASTSATAFSRPPKQVATLPPRRARSESLHSLADVATAAVVAAGCRGRRQRRLSQ